MKDLYLDWNNDGDVKKVSLKSFIHYMHGIEKWNYDMHCFNNAVMYVEAAITLLNLKTAITAF